MVHISVIVPFYNSERYIADCLNGLLSQTYPKQNYEIIMIDNNSTDGSAEIVRRYPAVKLISEKKQGAYAARNRGIREAHGDILAFTDPDCVPADDWLQEIASAMSYTEAGIVIGSHNFGDDSLVLSMLAAYEDEKNRYVFNSGIKEVYFGHTNNMAVRRRLFDECGPFVECPRGADTIFVRRCVERFSCQVVRYCSNVQVRHLEINRLGELLEKYSIYAGSRRKYQHIAHVRPLSNRERLHVFRRTVRSQRYSWLRAVFLFGLLAMGLICWTAGSFKAIWRLKRSGAPT